MTIEEVMQELESYGNENTKKILLKHGAREPFFGVKVADMKKIVKKVKKDQDLALALYDTNNGDAMYLAGLIADESKMTKSILDKWVKKADWSMISEYTVPWIAADSGLAWQCGLNWIDNKKDNIAAAGWSALASHLSICNNEDLDKAELDKLLSRVRERINDAQNREKYTMNGFLIALGSYVSEYQNKCQTIASEIGTVMVDMGGTACKVPDAKSYIQKVADKGRIGKKRKMARC